MNKDYSQVPYAEPSGLSEESQPFGFADDFIENAEPRCACVLLLDTSGSMNGDPINLESAVDRRASQF